MLGLALLGAFGYSLLVPLGDPDLAMHLAIGEWIVQHGRLPLVEPFAWTRAGAPFYAYSWLPEVTYFALLRWGGPAALHLLQGAIATAGVLATWWVARAAGWTAWTGALLALAHLLVVSQVGLVLRPHGVLGAAVPVAWAAALTISRALDRGARPRPWPALGWAAAAAVAANSHLLAPLVAAPLVLLVPFLGAAPATVAATAAAVALGLLATPYAPHWGGILRLNFAPNALFTFPSPVSEHTPGFVWLARGTDWAAAAGVLALVAVGVVRRERTRAWGAAADLLLAGLWVAGLVMFAIALRGLFLWWLLALPLVGAALARLPRPALSPVGRMTVGLVAVVPTIAAVGAARDLRRAAPFEGDVRSRVLPVPAARAALALADKLDRLAPGRAGRVMTVFAYGNALLWRLPRYSMSIDGRTIFPDSAAAIEGYRRGHAPDPPMPIASADVAIVPLGGRMATALECDAAWRRIAVARPRVNGTILDSAGLWARHTWLAGARGGPRADRGRVLP